MQNRVFKLVLIILFLIFTSLNITAFSGSGGTLTLDFGHISDISKTGRGGSIDANFVSGDTGFGLWSGAAITADVGVYFEATSPTVTITNPPNGFSTTATSVTLTYTGSDAENNISKYTVQLDNGTQIDNGLNLSYTFTGLSVGSHTLKVFATDSTGLNSSTASIAITITTKSNGDGDGGSGGGSAGGGGGIPGSFCRATTADPDGDCIPRNLDCNSFRKDIGECKIEDNLVCFNQACVSLFDIKILEFDSPIQLGEFFDFTYFLKGIGEINADVKVRFKIEKDGKIIASGLDTIYLGESEEKTETGKLFLPVGTTSGIYKFFIEVTFAGYTAQSQRTLDILVSEEEGTAIIEKLFDISFLLDSFLIKNSSELSGVAVFENFGTTQTTVNLTFLILDQHGVEVYNEQASITVLNEESLAWYYETLTELPNGKYTAVLEVLYRDNRSDKFNQNFEVKKDEDTFSVYNFIEIITLPRLGIGLIVLLLIGLIIWGYKKRKKVKTPIKITYDMLKEALPIKYDIIMVELIMKPSKKFKKNRKTRKKSKKRKSSIRKKKKKV